MKTGIDFGTRIYSESEIKEEVSLKEAIKAVEDSFAAYSSGRQCCLML